MPCKKFNIKQLFSLHEKFFKNRKQNDILKDQSRVLGDLMGRFKHPGNNNHFIEPKRSSTV